MRTSPLSSTADELLADYEHLKNFFRNEVSCHHEAQDLTQETFFRFLRRTSSETLESPRQMLFRIARNLLIDRFRKASHAGSPSTDEEIPALFSNPSTRLETSEQLAAAVSAVRMLPPRCKKIFIMSRFGDLTYDQIAGQLGVSVSTVEKEIITALVACRNALES
ncbi:MAG: sigma-70 family RNA polymerase sigma factor [Luteolibacter sp.]